MPVDLPSDPTRHSLGASMERLRHRWGWIVALGAILDLAGIVALGSVVMATYAAVTVVGVMMIIGGAAELALGFRARDWAHFFLWVLGGIFYVAGGAFLLASPLAASLVLTLLLGAGLVAAGLLRLFLAFQLPSSRSRLVVIVGAALTLLLGILIVVGWPTNSFYVLGMLLAINLMFTGIGWMMFGFWLRDMGRGAHRTGP
jgi:uncharacterized membrane protein HdeD (DUF308 family)